MTPGASIIPLFVAISLAGAFLISIVGKKIKWFPDFLGNLTTFVLLCLSAFALKLSNSCGTIVYSVGFWRPPAGIALVLDGLTSFMLVTVNLIAFIVSIYAINYMERYTSKWKFYTLFLLMLAGMNGVIITGDIFNLFVFLEIASVASYALVAFGTERHELEAAFKYAVMSTVGSLFI
ncbi:MAG: NADH/ubiquinone/plastoquinone (complex I), partial [Candidatus Omnitrophica bacterium]|nr:NADH/ubiquinone/plastoquinone (complex I) [Candidatus Omnitrophota bacterium]